MPINMWKFCFRYCLASSWGVGVSFNRAIDLKMSGRFNCTINGYVWWYMSPSLIGYIRGPRLRCHMRGQRTNGWCEWGEASRLGRKRGGGWYGQTLPNLPPLFLPHSPISRPLSHTCDFNLYISSCLTTRRSTQTSTTFWLPPRRKSKGVLNF